MRRNSFTLIEILVYISTSIIIFVAIFSSLIWFIHSNTKTKVMEETLNNAGRAMDIMSYEIREARSLYTPTSIFDSHPGQISLETTHHLPEGEETTFVDFYLCETQLCFKKESQSPIFLTSDNVEVKNLVFTKIMTESIPSVEINLRIDYKNPTNRPEYQASVNLKSTISLRSY